MNLSRANLPALIAQWARAVADLERQVDTLSSETVPPDISSELNVRHEIAQRIRARSTTAETRDLLADVDMAFRDITVDSPTCLGGDDVAVANGWTSQREWYYWRAPRIRTS